MPEAPSFDALLRQLASLTARLAEAEHTIIALRAAAVDGAAGRPSGRGGREAGSRLEERVRERTRELTVLTEELHAEIRDRMVAEETLLAEKAYREAMENCLVAGVVAVDARGRHIHVNDAFCAMTGFRREEILGAGIPYPYWPPEEGRAYAAAIRKVLRGEAAPGGLEFRFARRDGRSLEVLVHASPLTVSGKVVGSLASIHDISDRKRMESALRESEARFRSLVEDLPIGICILQEGRIVFANPEQERLFCPPSASVPAVRSLNIHPEDAPVFEALCRTRTPVNPLAKETDLRLLPRGEEDAAGEMRWVRCKAGSVRYEGRDAVLLSMMDVTRAKDLEHLVAVQERLASLGQFSAGIAHEIRNPLSGINICLSSLEQIVGQSAEMDPADRTRSIEIMEKTKAASTRIATVIQSVMDFSKPTPRRLVPVNLNHLAGKAVRISAAVLQKHGIAVSEELAPDLPRCLADPSLMEQVVLNLITNAVQAMETLDGPRRLAIVSSAENGRVVLRVSDSGPGVPPRIRGKIFDPFFTTRKAGYGIGLSFSQRVVTEHGGSLTVGTSRWGGAEFRIELPLETYVAPA
jgi:PAS domain S-box-containing protein